MRALRCARPPRSLAFVLALAACADPSKAPPADTGAALEDCGSERWVGAWAAAPTDTTEPVVDQSLRVVFTPLRGGELVRVRLSNRLGDRPLRLTDLHLGIQETDATVQPGSQRALSFSGAATVEIPAGEDVLSDELALSFSAMQRLSLSLHVPAPGGALTRHMVAKQTSFRAPASAGVVAGDEDGAAFTETTGAWPLLTGLEVLAPGDAAVVAAVGDSLTDGDHGTSGGHDTDTRYPDALARRLDGDPLSVVNLGIGGNRVLSDAAFPGMGDALGTRLADDVLSRADLTDVVVFEGINDLGIPPGASVDALLDGLAGVVDRLQAPREGLPTLRVHVATLTPVGGTTGVLANYAAHEPERQAINDAIRGGALSDHVLDFDAVVRDADDPSRIAAGFDGGDGLHLSAEGYAALAGAVPLDGFARRRCAP